MKKLTILLILLGISVSLSAQEEVWYTGKPIADIRFEGLDSVSENELFGLMRSYIGQAYSESLSWEIQSKLYALEYFDLILPEIREAGADRSSVIVIFQVQEKALVDEILFSGNSRIKRRDLLDAILVNGGDLLNPGALRADEQAIIDLYLDKGFINAVATVEHRVDEASNRASIVFTIAEGNQTKISDIRFVGNDVHVSDSALRGLMTTKAQSLFNKGLFVETKLQEDLKAIESYYGDLGLINASILDTNKEIVLDKEENLNKMVITIIIEEGDIWSFGGITFSGNKIYTTEELEDLVTQETGKTFNLTAFQIDYQRITDLYFENGYIFNTFAYEEIRDEENRVISYRVDVVERDRAHIANIIIRGNSKTKSYVIRREIPLEEGAIFSKAKILEGMINLQSLQYFDAVEPTPYPSETDGLMDLVVDVAEGKTSDIGFGLSFSGGADFPISAQLNWNDRNFLGRGQILGADLSVSPDVQRLSVRFTEPRILGLRWLGGISLSYDHRVRRRINQDADSNGVPDSFNTMEEYAAAGSVVPQDSQMEYDSHSIGTGLNTGYTWMTRVGRVIVSTGFQFNWEYVVYDPSVYRPYNALIRDNLRKWDYSDSFTVRLAWDTRDLQFDPTRGFVLSETVTFAGILQNLSSRNYIKTVSRFNYNIMLFDVPVGKKGRTFRGVLSINSAFSALFDKPWMTVDGDIAETNGFTVDGMFIARGWPAKFSDYYRYLWDNTLMLKLPIIPNILSFDIFLDAVGAWRTTNGETSALHKWSGNDWRFSLGAGLRFANPSFPIGIYLVKRFQWKDDVFTWFPDAAGDQRYEFPKAGMDLVIAFELDIY